MYLLLHCLKEIFLNWNYAKQEKVTIPHPDIVIKPTVRVSNEADIVIDGMLITGRGLGTVLDFSLAIVHKLFGHGRARSVAEGIVFEYGKRYWGQSPRLSTLTGHKFPCWYEKGMTGMWLFSDDKNEALRLSSACPNEGKQQTESGFVWSPCLYGATQKVWSWWPISNLYPGTHYRRSKYSTIFFVNAVICTSLATYAKLYQGLCGLTYSQNGWCELLTIIIDIEDAVINIQHVWVLRKCITRLKIWVC